MQCHSTSIKSHQLKLSVTPITKRIVEEISKRCCFIDACGMFDRPRKTVNRNVKNFRSNDIGTYLVMLKIGTNNAVIGYILNEKFLKLYSHIPQKLIFIA